MSDLPEPLDWRDWADPAPGRPLPPIERTDHHAALQDALTGLSDDATPCALLVTGPANVRWVTGFTGSNGAALVLPDDVLLLTDPRYEGRAAVESPGIEVVICRELVDEAIGRAAAAGVRRLVFEAQHVTFAQGTAIKSAVAEAGLVDCVSANGVVERERTTKNPPELARLAFACAITEAVLDDVLATSLAGRSERDVARAIEDGMRAREASVGFETIVAAGPNGAVPHHEPTGRVIDLGELVTIDCGVRIDGYHADTTRTVAAGRLPSGPAADLADVFAVVAGAQQAGVEAAVVGATGGDVDRACREHITEAGYGAAFVHGTGHGVGLEIHEAPAVASTAAATLADRTPLTVEPGIYLPGRGGVRIEDTVVTVPDGAATRLTSSPRELLVV